MASAGHAHHAAKTWMRDGFLISTDSSLIPVDAISKAFASEQLYWASQLPEAAIREMLDNSLCLGLYSPTPAPPPPGDQDQDQDAGPDPAETLHEIAGHVRPERGLHPAAHHPEPSSGKQQDQSQEQLPLIGFARFITDRVTFAYLNDVYILPEWQGQGLGKWLISCAQELVEEMPHLRRTMALVGHGKENSIDLYGSLMKMTPVQSPTVVLVSLLPLCSAFAVLHCLVQFMGTELTVKQTWRGPGGTF